MSLALSSITRILAGGIVQHCNPVKKPSLEHNAARRDPRIGSLQFFWNNPFIQEVREPRMCLPDLPIGARQLLGYRMDTLCAVRMGQTARDFIHYPVVDCSYLVKLCGRFQEVLGKATMNTRWQLICAIDAQRHTSPIEVCVSTAIGAPNHVLPS